jgi:hypothetical protein
VRGCEYNPASSMAFIPAIIEFWTRTTEASSIESQDRHLERNPKRCTSRYGTRPIVSESR